MFSLQYKDELFDLTYGILSPFFCPLPFTWHSPYGLYVWATLSFACFVSRLAIWTQISFGNSNSMGYE